MKRSTTRALAASAFTAGAIFTTGAALLHAPLFYASATMAVICAIVAVVVLVMGELRTPDSPAPAHDDPYGELTTADICRVLGVDIPPPRYDPASVRFRGVGLPAYGVGRLRLARDQELAADAALADALVTVTDEDLMAEAFRRGLVVHAPA